MLNPSRSYRTVAPVGLCVSTVSTTFTKPDSKAEAIAVDRTQAA